MMKKQRPYSERYEGMQLKIESKKLKSGKCQVKFRTQGLTEKDFYGYVLVDGSKTLREVVGEIKEKLMEIGDPARYYQQNLYSLGSRNEAEQEFVIFSLSNA